MHRRLAGRVAAADDDHVLVAAALGVGRPSPRGRRRRRGSGRRPRPAARASARRSPSRRERASTCWPSSRSTRTRPSGPSASSTARWKLESTASKRRACSVALRVSSLPEIPAREAEVVLDPRARPGLAAGRPGLGDERAQALRAAVDRRRQPGRPGAEHDEVEALAVDLGAQPERARDLRGGRVAHHVASRGRAPASPRAGSRATRASRRSRRRCRRRTSAPAAGCARAGRAPRTRAASRARRSAASRRGPRPRATRAAPAACGRCARRTRASARPSRAARARSKAITSVGSTATHALIVGSPVKTAMSPMKVRLSACATWTSLPGLRSTNSTRPRSMT